MGYYGMGDVGGVRAEMGVVGSRRSWGAGGDESVEGGEGGGAAGVSLIYFSVYSMLTLV